MRVKLRHYPLANDYGGTGWEKEVPVATVRWHRNRWKKSNEAAEKLAEALQGIIDIGKRDLTNPKYDGYFTWAKEALAAYREKDGTMTDKPTDLQAALREACEEAAEGCIDSLDDTAYANEYQIRKFTDIIERNMTPVFEALRDSVIEECARECDEHKSVKELKGQDERAFTAMILAKSVRALKGAPR